ncbi:MAG: S8 family serine peptidase [Bdellovibrionia bacterium]
MKNRYLGLCFLSFVSFNQIFAYDQVPLVVGIMDSAIDLSLPELEQRVSRTNPEIIENNNIVFKTNEAIFRDSASVEAATKYYHATHIAGVITGVTFKALFMKDMNAAIARYGVEEVHSHFKDDFRNLVLEGRAQLRCIEIDAVETDFNRRFYLQKTEKDYADFFLDMILRLKQTIAKCELREKGEKSKSGEDNVWEKDLRISNTPLQIVPILLDVSPDVINSAVDEINRRIRVSAVSIVNMSLSLPKVDPKFTKGVGHRVFQEIILQNPEVIFVEAAGNNGTDLDQNSSELFFDSSEISPKNLILVANAETYDVDDSNRLNPESNYGEKSVHVAATGTNVISLKAGGGFIELTGTSMAVPSVVRTLSQIRRGNPKLTAAETIQLFLEEFTVSLKSLEGKIQGARFHRSIDLR